MKIRPFLPAIFLLLLTVNSALRFYWAGNLMPNLPGIAIFLSLAGFLGWRAWTIATGKSFAGDHAATDGLPWEEALSAGRTFFLVCILATVLFLAYASFDPKILRGANLEAIVILPLAIGPAGAILIGICRFFRRR